MISKLVSYIYAKSRKMLEVTAGFQKLTLMHEIAHGV